MHQLETTNEMNTDDGPPAPRNRDHQQQRVDFSSHVLEDRVNFDTETEGSSSGGYDPRYPSGGFNHQGGINNVKEDPPAGFLQTPAQLPREQLTATTVNDTTLTVSRFGRDFSRLATNTPRNFAAVGQTPMTGASLGSTNPTPYSTMAGSGILKSSNYKTATVNALNNDAQMNRGISAMGLVRGNNPLGPTPLVRRNDPGKNKQQEQPQQQLLLQQQLPTPSPGMHYHFPATSDIKTFDGLPPPKKRMSTAEEEDPAMLRYASTAGSDQSPLIAKGPKKEEESEMDEIEASRMPPMQQQTQPDGILRDSSASAFASGVPPREHQLQQTSAQKAPAALTEFPFFFDGYASWVCRHCSHISPYYRGQNYIWHFPQAPPNEFVDSHLVVCPGLNPSSEPSLTQHQHPQFHPVPPQAPYQQQALYGNQKNGAPDPPTGRTPPPILPKKGGKGGDHAPHYFHGQPYPAQPYPPGQPPYNMVPHPQIGAQPPYMVPPPGAQQPPFPFGLSGTADPSPGRKKSKATGKNISPKGLPSDDETYTKAIEHLEDAEDTMPDLSQPESDIGSSLVEPSDSELITDYFFHIMKQLVVCRFAEKDRKTRGGKRENVNIGYGGLQCRHCINTASSRKFFWSNVDRLANSFAEIPTHVLKCKSTPEDIKDSLLVLKGRHSDQMQSLARGSQKVFFRRMWRRLHDGDETNGATPISQKPSADDSESGNSDTASNSAAVHPNPARMLADTLAAESRKTAARHDAASTLDQPGNDSSKTVLLAIPEDKDWLSDDHCFVRNNIEVFVATQYDCKQATDERKYPIKLGWVGFRCLHCAKTPRGARDGAVFYPYSVSGIFESVREFQRLHFEKCTNLPPDVVEAFRSVNKASTTLSSVLRRYYVQSARALGLIDFPDGGIKAGAKVGCLVMLRLPRCSHN